MQQTADVIGKAAHIVHNSACRIGNAFCKSVDEILAPSKRLFGQRLDEVHSLVDAACSSTVDCAGHAFTCISHALEHGAPQRCQRGRQSAEEIKNAVPDGLNIGADRLAQAGNGGKESVPRGRNPRADGDHGGRQEGFDAIPSRFYACRYCVTCGNDGRQNCVPSGRHECRDRVHDAADGLLNTRPDSLNGGADCLAYRAYDKKKAVPCGSYTADKCGDNTFNNSLYAIPDVGYGRRQQRQDVGNVAAQHIKIAGDKIANHKHNAKHRCFDDIPDICKNLHNAIESGCHAAANDSPDRLQATGNAVCNGSYDILDTIPDR